ncbi:MAG: SUMF1/EgtB/PvdO family nonheme iron enzyme [Terriglobales bacterium]
MLALQDTVDVRHELLERLNQARAETDRLFDHVKPEFLYERPIPERHRIVFYIGHLEAFDWNLLRERVLGRTTFHSEFDNLFAFGIDPVDGGLPSDQPSDWPSLAQVRDYVNQVRQALDEGLAAARLKDRAEQQGIFRNQLLNVAIEHRLMHAETLAYMLHQLPFDQKVRKPHVPELAAVQVKPRMIEIPAGTATLGLSRCKTNLFGWDNEYEEHPIAVPAFSISQYEVTNREYLQFINAGGYENQALWREADWKWKTQHNISHPVFWNHVNGGWQYRTMFEDIPLPPDWPVYVSHAEASAYARWAGMALPTEAQWHRAAYGTPEGTERPYPWGAESPDPRFGNFDFESWDPTPVGAFQQGESAFGVRDLMGNGWEWTATAFAPFPGFQPFEFYPGYSANFFDGEHYVMKGGSARTAACMLRRSFRNWFQSHYQYVYAGFRCVRN